jgi:hypothetical protein
MIGETFLIVVGTVLAAGIIFELCAVIVAPPGYEDEAGFHAGMESAKMRKTAGLGRAQADRPQ